MHPCAADAHRQCTGDAESHLRRTRRRSVQSLPMRQAPSDREEPQTQAWRAASSSFLLGSIRALTHRALHNPGAHPAPQRALVMSRSYNAPSTASARMAAAIPVRKCARMRTSSVANCCQDQTSHPLAFCAIVVTARLTPRALAACVHAAQRGQGHTAEVTYTAPAAPVTAA